MVHAEEEITKGQVVYRALTGSNGKTRFAMATTMLGSPINATPICRAQEKEDAVGSHHCAPCLCLCYGGS
jgi:hypothetical protein